jgi:hypothetical protein
MQDPRRLTMTCTVGFSVSTVHILKIVFIESMNGNKDI